MATFLTTLKTSSTLEDIIKNAKYNLTIVSPYLKISRLLKDRLLEASKKGVKIKFIYGKKEMLQAEVRDLFLNLKNLEIYYCDNLHAKCYFNDDSMIITSMNLYEFSEKNNREIGILLEKSNDGLLFSDALKEINSIEVISVRINLKEIIGNENRNGNISHYNTNYRNNRSYNQGFCIRCEVNIPLEPNNPYCNNCYRTWLQFSNPYYTENVCHICGSNHSTNMKEPICYKCLKTHYR